MPPSTTMENDKRSQIAELNKLASTIIQDPIHSNQIIRFIDALANLENSNAEDSYIETLIRCVAKIFNFFIDSREWVLSNDTDSESKAINSYKSYLIGWYDIVIDELLKIVSNEGKAKFSLNIQKLALTTLIKFVEEEGKLFMIMFMQKTVQVLQPFFCLQGNSHFAQHQLSRSLTFLASFFLRSSDLCFLKLRTIKS